LILTGYAALCLAYLTWCWIDDLTELGGDSAMYMLMARHLSPFHPASAIVAEAVRTSAYPPLFPLLIGLCGGSMLAGHLVAVASLLAALPVLYLWLRSEGLGWASSAWLTAVFAMMPGTYLLALNIWTENQYLLFSLVALLAVRQAESTATRNPRAWWLGAVAVALATLTRAAALPLLAAFSVHLLIRRPRGWFWLLLAAATPFAAWALAGHSQQSGFSNYLGQWSGRYAQDPLQALQQQVAEESHRLLGAWVQGWTGSSDHRSPLRYVSLGVGLIGVAGGLRRLAQLRFDGLYIAFYAALLLIWPFPAEAERLEYVLAPVLLAQGALLLQAGAAARARDQRVLPLYLGVLTLAISPALALNAQRYFQPAPGGLALVRHTPDWYGDNRLYATRSALLAALNFNALRQVAEAVPPGACIFAIKPSVITLYTGRKSAVPPPSSTDDAAFERDIGKCRYLYPMALVSPTFQEPFYPLKRLGGRGKALLEAAGGDEVHRETYGLLIDLGPDVPALGALP